MFRPRTPQVSSTLAGALTGSLAALTKGDDLGRRAELQLSACLYAAGAALMAGAPELSVLLIVRTPLKNFAPLKASLRRNALHRSAPRVSFPRCDFGGASATSHAV